MKIEIRKYGEILTSRPAGREAALAMKAYVKPSSDENIELDFSGVLSVAPAWLDEVLKYLWDEFGKERVILLPTENKSIIVSLNIIESES